MLWAQIPTAHHRTETTLLKQEGGPPRRHHPDLTPLTKLYESVHGIIEVTDELPGKKKGEDNHINTKNSNKILSTPEVPPKGPLSITTPVLKSSLILTSFFDLS